VQSVWARLSSPDGRRAAPAIALAFVALGLGWLSHDLWDGSARWLPIAIGVGVLTSFLAIDAPELAGVLLAAIGTLVAATDVPDQWHLAVRSTGSAFILAGVSAFWARQPDRIEPAAIRAVISTVLVVLATGAVIVTFAFCMALNHMFGG
jgi:hypothetical protein